MPETTEGLEFDVNGICTACTSSEQKMHINWKERREILESLIDEAKKNAKENDSPYDCIVPISGGKDSTYQLHVLVNVFKLRVLAVTFSHNWYSKIGFYNLVNCLEEFNVDHIQFTPNRKSVVVAARKSLQAIGDACWHCHSGVGSFPLHIAVKFKIPLLIWGESIAETSGRASHFNPVLKFDRDYFLRVSAKISVDDFSSNPEERRMFQLFEPPTMEECIEQEVHGIHIGDFIFWDEEKQLEFVQNEYGWIEDRVEGAYKGYKSVECIMPGVHDFTNYLKRGYGRATFQASMDVRQGLIGREEAAMIAQEFDQIEPAALQYFLNITGYSEEEFYNSMKELRKPQVSNSEIPVRQIVDSKKSSPKLPFVIEFINSIRKATKENDTRNN
jgi:N-acetyl sugar amidotransferase